MSRKRKIILKQNNMHFKAQSSYFCINKIQKQISRYYYQRIPQNRCFLLILLQERITDYDKLASDELLLLSNFFFITRL